MELSRRDALAALAGAGAVGVAGGGLVGRAIEAGAPRADVGRDASREVVVDVDADVLEPLVAAAEVLYPSTVEGHRSFVETYVLGRIDGRPAYREGLVETVETLEGVARDWHAAPFADLAPETRDALLSELGVAAADPVADGNVSERVRFFVVDELLYAFYTSPTGGRLVGIENPTGYPGGTESYRRGPPSGTGEGRTTEGDGGG